MGSSSIHPHFLHIATEVPSPHVSGDTLPTERLITADGPEGASCKRGCDPHFAAEGRAGCSQAEPSSSVLAPPRFHDTGSKSEETTRSTPRAHPPRSRRPSSTAPRAPATSASYHSSDSSSASEDEDFDSQAPDDDSESARLPEFASSSSAKLFPASPWAVSLWKQARRVKVPAAVSFSDEEDEEA